MLKAFNKYGNAIEPPEFIELQWNRKFYDYGNFSLHMPLSVYDSGLKYLQFEGRPETGVVQKRYYENQNGIDYITLSGFFIDKLLDMGVAAWKIPFKVEQSGPSGATWNPVAIKLALWLTFSQYNQHLWDEVKAPDDPDPGYQESVDEYNEKLMIFKYRGSNLYSTEFSKEFLFPHGLNYIIEPGERMGQAFKKTFKPYKISVGAEPIFNPSGRERENMEPLIGLLLTSKEAKDKSRLVYFGEAFENIKKIEYNFDDSCIISDYTIRQEVPNESRFPSRSREYDYQQGKAFYYIYEHFMEPNNAPTDLGKSYPAGFIDSSIETFDNDLTESEVKEQMKRAALLDMLNHYKVESFSVDVMQNSFYYLKDYDLGDYCTIISTKLGNIPYKAQIIEVRERIAENKNEIEIVFGTPQKNKYRKVVM
ncbi:MAG: hypothetical protein Q4E28_05025 [Clostridia bacterium]|nr:hypothetical protein [Clostridia bacterium]